MVSDSARQKLIDSQLRPVGVSDKPLLAAFARVDRTEFLPDSARDLAYRDRAISAKEGAFLPPAALALLLQELELKPGQSLLLLGPDADYAAALAKDMGIDAVAKTGGKLAAGKKADAPFDRIAILGAIEDLPSAISDQLADGGVIVSGLMSGGVTRLAAARKSGGSMALDPFADAQIPVLQQFNRAPAFTF